MYKMVKTKVNLNLLNLELNTLAHILLKMNINNKSFKIEMYKNIIKTTSFKLQNNKNESILHYICQNKWWKKIKDVLLYKKIDVNIRDINDKRPIDFINKANKDEFIDLLTQSFINLLKFKGEHYWTNKIYDMGSKKKL